MLITISITILYILNAVWMGGGEPPSKQHAICALIRKYLCKLYEHTRVRESLSKQHIQGTFHRQCPSKWEAWHHQKCENSSFAPCISSSIYVDPISKAILRVSISSHWSRWHLPQRNGGMLSLIPQGARSSIMYQSWLSPHVWISLKGHFDEWALCQKYSWI